MNPFRHAWHLATRFLGVVTSRPLGPRAQDEINRVLSPEEANLFWRQQSIDQRHSYDVAMRVKAELVDHDEAVAAALLHDVGKRHSNLGAIARSLATVIDTMRLPLPQRWRDYRDHGQIGAEDLDRVGASRLAVAFAKHDPDPAFEERVWNALVDADNE